eukprot:NODE_2239_length_1644_cov_65.666009_g1918_i0.p1 GENE.NODE_2239_length_1644_cov_65.666009_g1918_i0~~NODE_2239_length_1644_cov_65.666009_g1918_i0.p1  ORF type:complete len:511 (-),score=107.12 NODE_2239_length_1644_cov_65.666009_g1918_i0:111-1538(-)
MFALSGTSAGSTSTGNWYHDEVGKLFPQKTFFDQVSAAGMTWRNYYNDTPWELFMEGLAHHPENLQSLEQFFKDAREGTLPNYAWINPLSGINITTGVGSNDQHPDHDIAAGEQFYKDVYEALRSSPQWNETLFIITFDEHGGFYDHVPTPLNVPPPGDGEKSYPDEGFLFDRLGIRIPTILISPWIPKGTVISGPPESQKPFPNSEYELTSIMATTRKLLNMDPTPLTKRDAWAATFEHVLSLKTPRKDCPVHLPNAPPPTPGYREIEANLPLNSLQKDIASIHAHLTTKPFPDHIKSQGEISGWLQKHYEIHSETTKRWKSSKTNSQYVLQCRPDGASGWVAKSWNVAISKDVDHNLIYLTDSNPNLCLDSVDAKVGTTVQVSVCLPSPDLKTNRDRAQWWYLAKDATIRPYVNTTLCLTNYEYSGNALLQLQPCTDKVEQHWAYHGAAPGDGGGGALYFGDDTNSLGVVSAN